MGLTLRPYQQEIFDSIKTNGNTLVVLPTGLGKTHIALAMIKKTMKEGKTSLFLTPTKPLARQHAQTIQKFLPEAAATTSLVTGELPNTKRAHLYSSKIIVSTPQTIRNDIKNKIYQTPGTGLVIFDEAHRAVGDYAYVPIAENLPPECISIALTASPGGDRARIKEVLNNLKIKNIQIRVETDRGIQEHTHKLDISWLNVELSPKLKEADHLLSSLIKEYAQKFSNAPQRPPIISKKNFILYGKRLQAMRHPAKYTFLSYYYTLLHLLHMQELLQTQGPHPPLKYLKKLNPTSRSTLAITRRPETAKIQQLLLSAGDHPKTMRLLRLLSELGSRKIILFVQYRDQINRIKELLEQKGFPARIFVGKRDGFTRKMQEETMDAFRRDEFQILIASSIGEEGLDIPAVDSVIFYEPIPSEIRSIQRRGRAGRFRKGSIYILVTKSTRDEYYFWASRKREQKMKEILLSLQKELERKHSPIPPKKEKTTKPNQSTLQSFI